MGKAEDLPVEAKPKYSKHDPLAAADRNSNGAGMDDGEAPPPYSEEAPEIIADRLSNLTFDMSMLCPAQCVAHLKLLEAFHRLRREISDADGLFGLKIPRRFRTTSSHQEEEPTLQIRFQEKRWQVFVTRAVDRFEQWIERCVPSSVGGYSIATFKRKDAERIFKLTDHASNKLDKFLVKERLPPLDVLMVWHSYLLNPHCFFDDCVRYMRMDFWATGLPIEAIDQCIDVKTFEYNPPSSAKDYFQEKTNRKWNNLDDPAEKVIECPHCERKLSVPFTLGFGYSHRKKQWPPGCGYADARFRVRCKCRYYTPFIDHDSLRVGRFYKDLEMLWEQDRPLPTTLVRVDGRLTPTVGSSDSKLLSDFPNQLALVPEVRSKLQKVVTDCPRIATMSNIRAVLAASMSNKLYTNGKYASKHDEQVIQRAAVRRMISCYWWNSSPFGLDLVSAVLRQGVFITKMHQINWLRSPTLNSVAERVIIRHKRFFEIMGSNPRKELVPTLDIDLAWHTDQLSPRRYQRFSISTTGRFIDHDDKIEETRLGECFEWTSQAYEKRYGERYSQCFCWYCEAIRAESALSSLASRFFHTRGSSKAVGKLPATSADQSLPPYQDSTYLSTAPHISAHNAVRDSSATGEVRRKTYEAKLDAAYHRACEQARRKGGPEPHRPAFYSGDGTSPASYILPYEVDSALADTAWLYAADPTAVCSDARTYGHCVATSSGGIY